MAEKQPPVDASLVKLLTDFDGHARAAPANTAMEFEIRFKIEAVDEYKKLLSNVLGDAKIVTVTRSINIIQDTHTPAKTKTKSSESRIATRMYHERTVGSAVSIVKDDAYIFSTKTLLGVVAVANEFIPYKFAVSAEAAAPQFSVETFARIRIKLRISIILAQFSDWRLDFTLVNELTNSAGLQEKRDALFKPFSMPKLMESVAFEAAGAREFEIEFIGNHAAAPGVTTAPGVTDIYALIEYVRTTGGFTYAQTNEYQQAIYAVAGLIYPPSKAKDYINKLGRKHMGIAITGLDRATYFKEILPNVTNWMVTIKADGEGVIGHVTAQGQNNIIGGDLKTAKAKKAPEKPIVYDAEIIGGVQYIFDVYLFGGENLLQTSDLGTRIAYIPRVLEYVENAVSKEYVQLTENYPTELKRLWNRKHEFPVDGIIFGDKYKWKPADKLTIDFLVTHAPPAFAQSGCETYILWCGMSKSQKDRHNIRPLNGYNHIFAGRTFYGYFPIQFGPPDNPMAYIYTAKHASPEAKTGPAEIHGRICEFARSGDAWIFIRIRTDRDAEVARGSYFGNNIEVAISIWNTIHDPLTFDMLLTDRDEAVTPYFATTDQMYKSANQFSSFVKNKTIHDFTNLSWVVDLAAGRGADLWRWSRNKIKNVLAIDNDADALKELQKRQTTILREVSTYKTAVYTHRADLNSPWHPLVTSLRSLFPLPKDGVPLVVCNMAIHYMCENDVTISNFAMIVDQSLMPSGHFVFTCYNGERIFELLGSKPKVEYRDGDTLKYSIVRAYEPGQFHNFGQVIKPLLGCAGGVHREEWLVNIAYVIRVFQARGFVLQTQARFDSLLEEYSIDNLDAYDTLSDADCAHLGLYDYVILKKAEDMPIPKAVQPADQKDDMKLPRGKAAFLEQKDESTHSASKAQAAIPFIVQSVPLELMPTKDVKLVVDTPAGDVIRENGRGIIVLPGNKLRDSILPGWRINVNSQFEAVVVEVHKFTNTTNLFNAIGAAELGLDSSKTAADFDAEFKAKYKLKATANGIIALRVQKI